MPTAEDTLAPVQEAHARLGLLIECGPDTDDLMGELRAIRALLSVAVSDLDALAQIPNWGDDEDHPWSDWVYEVESNDTRRGYAEWLLAQREEG